MWRAVLPSGWRSKTWPMASHTTFASGPKLSLTAPRLRPTSPLDPEKVGCYNFSLLQCQYSNPLRTPLSFFIHRSCFLRSSGPSRRTLYFSIWHSSHTALDKWRSRPCTHHAIRHRGQTIWWASYKHTYCLSFNLSTVHFNFIHRFSYFAFRWRIVGHSHQRHSQRSDILHA